MNVPAKRCSLASPARRFHWRLSNQTCIKLLKDCPVKAGVMYSAGKQVARHLSLFRIRQSTVVKSDRARRPDTISCGSVTALWLCSFSHLGFGMLFLRTFSGGSERGFITTGASGRKTA